MLSHIILTQWQQPVASSEALDLLHWEMGTVIYRRFAMAIKTATFLGVFVDCFCLPIALAAAGAIRSKYLPNGGIQWLSQCCLYCSGAPPWPSKWPADEVHSFVIVEFVINNNRSQRPYYGPLKLKLRYSNIYYNVIILLLCSGHPPTTMDAVLAIIVAGGQANINLT
jgi:hypothetical protein